MKCELIENLLPLFAGGELSDEERALIQSHLKRCRTCTESLLFYTQLEKSLVARRTLRPVPDRTAERVVRRLGFVRPWDTVKSLIGLPAYVSAALIAIGVALLFVRTPLQKFIAGLELSFRPTQGLERLAACISAFTGTDPWLVFTLYLGVLGITLLAGSWMVLRFARR